MPKKLWLPNSTSKNLESEETKPFLNEGLVYSFRYNDFSNPSCQYTHTHYNGTYINLAGEKLFVLATCMKDLVCVFCNTTTSNYQPIPQS